MVERQRIPSILAQRHDGYRFAPPILRMTAACQPQMPPALHGQFLDPLSRACASIGL